MVDKHLDLLEPRGTLILEVPNFRATVCAAQVFRPKNLERHNTEIMNFGFFKKIVKSINLILNAEHTGGFFDFWWENSGQQKYRS